MTSRTSSIALVLVCLTAGCTLDYDGLVSGVGGAGSTSAATTTTTTSAATGTGTSSGTTSASTTVASSASSGTGGAGSSSGQGGEGGGELPGATPCADLALTFGDGYPESLGTSWVELGGTDAELSSGDERLVIAMSDGERGYIQTTANALDGCSVTVELLEIDPAVPEDVGDKTRASISSDGIGLAVEVSRGDDGPLCFLMSGAVDNPGGKVACGPDGPSRELRLRHTGAELCFDVGPPGGPLVPLGPCLVAPGPRRVQLGATTNDAATVRFGPVH